LPQLEISEQVVSIRFYHLFCSPLSLDAAEDPKEQCVGGEGKWIKISLLAARAGDTAEMKPRDLQSAYANNTLNPKM
jgi:hypothetical protein